METMTWEQLDQYKAKLIKGLLEYMASPATERSANGVRGMIECWLTVAHGQRRRDHRRPLDHGGDHGRG